MEQNLLVFWEGPKSLQKKGSGDRKQRRGGSFTYIYNSYQDSGNFSVSYPMIEGWGVTLRGTVFPSKFKSFFVFISTYSVLKQASPIKLNGNQ